MLFGDGTTSFATGFMSASSLNVGMGQMDGTGRARIIVGSPEATDSFGATGGVWHVRSAGGTGFSITRIRLFNTEQFGAGVAVGDFEGSGFGAIGSRGGSGNVTHLGLFDGASVGGTALFTFPPGGSDWVDIVR